MKHNAVKWAAAVALVSPAVAFGQLQLHLPFDTSFTDGGGNLVSPDSSGFGRDAYLNLAATNATFGVSGATIVPGGISGGALQLDGVNDFARVLAWDGITGNNARTIALWVKQASSALTPNDIWVGWGDTSGSARVRWDFGLPNASDAGMRIELNSGFAQLTGSPVANDAWHHVAVTYATGGTNVNFYLDGALYGTANFSANPVNTTDVNLGIVIGAGIREAAATSGNANRFVNGLIDDVRIYDTELTSTEITALVPEPTALALCGLCGVALMLRRWRRTS